MENKKGIIPVEDPGNSCRLGQGEKCCAFLVFNCSKNGGFECIKNDYQGNTIIHKRLIAGTMVAKGTGDWQECLLTEDKKDAGNNQVLQ